MEVRLFTRMPLEVPNLPNYPYVQKNTLYKVIIHSSEVRLFTRMPLEVPNLLNYPYVKIKKHFIK